MLLLHSILRTCSPHKLDYPIYHNMCPTKYLIIYIQCVLEIAVPLKILLSLKNTQGPVLWRSWGKAIACNSSIPIWVPV